MEYINIKKGYTKEDIEQVAGIIKLGGVVIIPTDTVYGIAADMTNEVAVKKVFDLKGRKLSNPMSILVSNMDMIRKFTKNITKMEEKVINNFFPGALTIILEKNNLVPDIVTSGLNTVGVRSPEDDFLLELIRCIRKTDCSNQL